MVYYDILLVAQCYSHIPATYSLYLCLYPCLYPLYPYYIYSYIYTQENKSDNFYRMSTGIIQYGTKCKRQLLENYLKTLNLTFKDFLRKHQHILYHLCFNSKCLCMKQCCLPKIRIIHPQQLEILFVKQSTARLSCHKGKHVDFCCCDVQQNVDLEDLDFTLIHLILVNCCNEIFWNCCLGSGTLEYFLNSNKHDIFHLWKSTSKCSLCSPTYILPVPNMKLHEDQWNILFNPVKDPRNATANIGITINNINNTNLACVILNNFCYLKMCVEKLTKLRNTMFAHATTAEIDKKIFKEKWKELEECLLYIAKHCNREIEMKADLENVMERSLDSNLCEKYRLSLLEQIKNRNTDKVNLNLILYPS